ncbi:MAG: SPOR domain-containing protein [Cytophagales bacterium]|nr:SPOR domain-containing protein [Cytophagales bacterium]MDW8385042.1 SPOR domain-containing protein [Flammeovirgaceae bacterium]
MKRLLYVIVFFTISLRAQKLTLYSFDKLSQEPVKITANPLPVDSKEVGDTSFTVYGGGTVDFALYFVHGDQYDNIFNPNPTGIVINGKYFNFYCTQELSFKQHVNMLLDAKEFTYLGKTYLVTISLWENCKDETCRYRCYNVFDITDKNDIKQYSFNSIFEGMASFGEFNSDGIIDFIRAAPKVPDNLTVTDADLARQYYLITAYTFLEGRIVQLANQSKSYYYIQAKGDEEVQQFQVLAADWFFPLKDSAGRQIEPKSYFPPYISFDPQQSYLFDSEGFRIEKNRWSVLVKKMSDIDGAKDLCAELSKHEFRDVYILPDQYSGKISYQVLVGNYQSKDMALDAQDMLKNIGIMGELFDLKVGYK